MRLKQIATACVAIAAATTQAETWGPKHFTYYGAVQNGIPVVNPRNTPVPFGDLFTLRLYGEPLAAAGCPPGGHDLATAPVDFIDSLSSVGLSYNSSSQAWTPTSTGSCTYAGYKGRIFGQINNLDYAGGIGLYTHTGPIPGSTQLPFVNAASGGDYIGGVIGVFERNGVAMDQLPRPFTGNSGDNNVRRMAVITEQSVQQFQADSLSAGQNLKQMTEVTLRHKGCWAAKTVQNGKICELQLQFNSAVSDGASSPYVGMMYDPGQGGKVIFGGNHRTYSLTSSYYDPNSGEHAVWSSWGAATQAGTFNNLTFQAEVTFNNLINMACIAIATKKNLQNVTQVTAQLAEEFFGGANTSYSDVNEWVLVSAFITQEVKNPSATTSRAILGGHFKSLQVLALPF